MRNKERELEKYRELKVDKVRETKDTKPESRALHGET
jgi:hypothetical protein